MKTEKAESLLEGYPKGTEFTYSFAALDDRYGLFYLCVASKKAISHAELRGYLDEAKKLIDEHGNVGLDIWHDQMTKRGLRPIPSTITIYGNETVTLDCIPKHESRD